MQNPFQGPVFLAVLLAPFVAFVLGSIVFNIMRARRAPRELARIAAHFGLHPKPGEEPVQRIEGYVHGYHVQATSKTGTKLSIDLQRPAGCELSTAPPTNRPVPGMAPFHFGDGTWNGLFQTRYATQGMATWLDGQRQPNTPLERFVRRWGPEIRYRQSNSAGLAIQDGALRCALRRGSDARNASSRITNILFFDDAHELIPDLIALAHSLDTQAPSQNRPLHGQPAPGLTFGA